MTTLLWIGGFIALFLLAVGAPIYYFSVRPRRLYARALLRQGQGNIPGALALLAKLYHDYPEHLPGAWRYAGLLFDRGKYAAARAVMEQLVRQQLGEDPSLIEVRRLLASTCEKMHDYKAALAEYDTLIAVAPAKTDFVFARGLLRRELRRWPAALDDFTLVVRERPTFDEALWRQAEALLALERPAEAKPVLRRLVELKRNHLSGLTALGGVLLDEGDARGALELLQAAVKEAGGTAPESYALLARAWRAMDEPLRGVRLLEEKLPLFAEARLRATLQHELALGYDRMGDRTKANACMREVYAVCPDLPGVREYLHDDFAALCEEDVVDYVMKLHVAEFERLAITMAEQLGFRVTRTQVISGEAVNVFAEQLKDAYTVQAIFYFRRWRHTIAELPVRELHRQVLEEHAQRGFLVVPGQFTASAVRESMSLRVELLDRARLVHLLREQQLRQAAPVRAAGRE